MSNSKFYRKSLTLLLPILEMINEGFIPTDIASWLDISKQLVSYYIKKAIESGYVRELWQDTFKAYELTQPGKNFLAMSNHQHYSSLSKPICRAENIRFKASVYKMPSSSVDCHTVGMRNWTQYTTEVDYIKIKLNDGDNDA
jgi:predicted transcriptional regulator